LRNFANEKKAGNSAVKSDRQLMSFASSCSVPETVNGMEPHFQVASMWWSVLAAFTDRKGWKFGGKVLQTAHVLRMFCARNGEWRGTR